MKNETFNSFFDISYKTLLNEEISVPASIEIEDNKDTTVNIKLSPVVNNRFRSKSRRIIIKGEDGSIPDWAANSRYKTKKAAQADIDAHSRKSETEEKQEEQEEQDEKDEDNKN